MPSDLIVIYGAPLTGKTTVAWELGRSMATKTAIVSTDGLLAGAIAVPDADRPAELDMAHLQLRLLVANYLKNGYNVIVEGAFLFEEAGTLLSYEADIDQLVALMRNLTQRVLVVRLTAAASTLAERGRATNRESELANAARLDAAYRPRYGDRFHSFDTGKLSPSEITRRLNEALSDS